MLFPALKSCMDDLGFCKNDTILERFVDRSETCDLLFKLAGKLAEVKSA